MNMKHLPKYANLIALCLCLASLVAPQAAAATLSITGVPAVAYPGVPFKFKITGISGDNCVLSSPGGKTTPFVLGANGNTVTHTPGNALGSYNFNVHCTNSGQSNFSVEVKASLGTTSQEAATPAAQIPAAAIPDGKSPVSSSNGKIDVTIWPIYYPLTVGYKDCPYSAVKVTKTDGSDFIEGENIEVRVGGRIMIQPSGSRFDGLVSSVNSTRMVVPSPYTKRMPKILSGVIYFCGDSFSQFSNASSPTVAEVQVSLLSMITLQTVLKMNISILPKSPEIIAIDNVRTQCEFGWMQTKFDSNIVLEQIQKPGKIGGITKFKGTLFRHGLLASFDTLEVRAYGEGVMDLGKLLAQATTDANGQFELSFKAVKSFSSTFPSYDFMIPERAEPIGIFSGPFVAFSFNVSLNMNKQGEYSPVLQDWIPTFPSKCLNAYSAYQASYPIGKGSLFQDDRHPVALYAAKKTLYGFKNKKSFQSISDSGSSSGGGRCSVRGYTTKTGKRVSSYTRSC
ncbi:unannotated protein [freshwater metagenome]|uniref:Unannotated protein n=1 Tax=freshwater metagenome TaxID=449393 RepID=A0A6J5YTN8_9ZZZZ